VREGNLVGTVAERKKTGFSGFFKKRSTKGGKKANLCPKKERGLKRLVRSPDEEGGTVGTIGKDIKEERDRGGDSPGGKKLCHAGKPFLRKGGPVARLSSP